MGMSGDMSIIKLKTYTKKHINMKKTIINPVVKDEVTFIQTASESKGQLTVLSVKLMPGGGTPLHYHKNFSETFTTIQGELTVYLKNKKMILKSGQKYTVQKGVTHRFANESDTAVFFSTTIQPGSEGFEKSLYILYGLAQDNQTNDKGVPKSLLDLAVVSKISDMHQPGMLALLSPLITLFYFIARSKNIDKKLQQRYCPDFL